MFFSPETIILSNLSSIKLLGREREGEGGRGERREGKGERGKGKEEILKEVTG